MPAISPLPHHYPVMPAPVLNSLLYGPEHGLQEQRARAREIVFAVDDLYKDFFENGMHPDVTAEMAAWGYNHIDYTTLRPTRNEDAQFLRRMIEDANGKLPARAICFWNDIQKIQAVIDLLKEFPALRFAVVTNFPHGNATPAEAARQIYAVRKLIGDIPNQVDIDSVIHYQAWLNGDEDLVRRILEAEAKACAECGFLWKSIQKISVHGRLHDPFKSIYRSSMMAMECGADCIKTSTGLAAKPPHNDFVPVDTAYPGNMVPMFLAIRDFNEKNGAMRWPKISGGQRSVVDIAAVRLLAKMSIGPDLVDSLVVGSGIRIRPSLFEYIANEMGQDALEILGPDAFTPRYNTIELPDFMRGLPDPRAINDRGSSPRFSAAGFAY